LFKTKKSENYALYKNNEKIDPKYVKFVLQFLDKFNFEKSMAKFKNKRLKSNWRPRKKQTK
jgi:Fe-S-cluster formation regulator IscX/YfhJ